MSEIFKIEAHELPSNRYSVGLKELTFADRREAIKKLPANEDSKTGYTLEHLLLNQCIIQINDQTLKTDPRDPISTIRYMPPEDTQFLVNVILAAFSIDEELAEDIRRLSQEFKMQPALSYTIPVDRMPTQAFSVTFKQPTTGDLIELEKEYPGANSGCGYSSDELLFAACVTHMDGKLVDDKPKELITFLNDWKHIDFQYAISVFLNVNYINTEQRTSARSLGKKLKTRRPNTVGRGSTTTDSTSPIEQSIPVSI